MTSAVIRNDLVVRIDVEDNGPGVPSNIINNIIEKFNRQSQKSRQSALFKENLMLFSTLVHALSFRIDISWA